jgi:hypothetical protein
LIYRLRDLVPSLPWYPNPLERLRDAWQVFRGRAVAVQYPRDGEFEMAVIEAGWPFAKEVSDYSPGGARE